MIEVNILDDKKQREGLNDEILNQIVLNRKKSCYYFVRYINFKIKFNLMLRKQKLGFTNIVI